MPAPAASERGEIIVRPVAVLRINDAFRYAVRYYDPRRRSSRSATTGSGSTLTHTSLNISSHQQWSGGVAYVSGSDRPSVAFKKATSRIFLTSGRTG